MKLPVNSCQLPVLRKAHICRFWALSVFCGSVVVIFAVSILQGICKADNRACTRYRSSAVGNAGNNVDLGGVL